MNNSDKTKDDSVTIALDNLMRKLVYKDNPSLVLTNEEEQTRIEEFKKSLYNYLIGNNS